MKNFCTILHFHLNYHVQRVGEDRRPWATTISTSVSQISFFLFRQPWATTISPSVPPFLTLPGKTTLLNAILRAFKVWSSKILKLDEPFRDHEICYLIFSTDWVFRAKDFCMHFLLLFIFCPLDPDPWILIFLRIRIKESAYFRGSGSRRSQNVADSNPDPTHCFKDEDNEEEEAVQFPYKSHIIHILSSMAKGNYFNAKY